MASVKTMNLKRTTRKTMLVMTRNLVAVVDLVVTRTMTTTLKIVTTIASAAGAIAGRMMITR